MCGGEVPSGRPLYILTMSPRNWIVDSIGAPAFERLASGLAGTALQSLLLDVMQARAGARSASALMAQYGRDRFCAPSQVDARAMLDVDAQLLAAAGAFEAVELSPVAPLGTCSVVGPCCPRRRTGAAAACTSRSRS